MKYDSCLALYDPAKEVDWVNVKNQLKPGAHVVSITPLLEHHRVTAAMEDCGLEIRDCIMFLGTPSYMIALGRLPLEGTVAENVLKHGVGALNIDAGRVGTEVVSTHSRGKNSAFPKRPGEKSVEESGRKKDQREGLNHQERSGRWPANCILDGSDGVKSYFPNVHGKKSFKKLTGYNFEVGNKVSGQKYESQAGLGEFGSAARFFYNVTEDNCLSALMTYLCKLCTPPGGKVMVVNTEEDAIISLESLGFDIIEYRNNFDYSSNE